MLGCTIYYVGVQYVYCVLGFDFTDSLRTQSFVIMILQRKITPVTPKIVQGLVRAGGAKLCIILSK